MQIGSKLDLVTEATDGTQAVLDEVGRIEEEVFGTEIPVDFETVKPSD